MNTVGVELGARRYDVHVGEIEPGDLAEAIGRAAGGARIVALVDAGLAEVSPLAREVTARLTQRFSAQCRLVPGGEASKTWQEAERSVQALVDSGADRSSLVVGLGGGAVCDHAAFVASTYMRGVKVVLVPTTVLGMVDASVGGKTALNVLSVKNLIGTFHQPQAVWVNPSFLETLPERDVRSGLAEIVKCGAVVDSSLLEGLDQPHIPVRGHVTADRIRRAVAAKAGIVAADERESGRRAVLNFGHTLGHAFEADSDYALRHGEAVSLGMAAALELGRRLGVTPDAVARQVVATLAALGLPVSFAGLVTPRSLRLLEADKKRRGDGGVLFVLCRGLGHPVLQRVEPTEIARLSL